MTDGGWFVEGDVAGFIGWLVEGELGWFVEGEVLGWLVDDAVLGWLVDGDVAVDDWVGAVSIVGLNDELLLEAVVELEALASPLTPRAASVCESSVPEPLIPLDCWNFSSAACVFGPAMPSAAPTLKPLSFNACCACFTVEESWLLAEGLPAANAAVAEAIIAAIASLRKIICNSFSVGGSGPATRI